MLACARAFGGHAIALGSLAALTGACILDRGGSGPALAGGGGSTVSSAGGDGSGGGSTGGAGGMGGEGGAAPECGDGVVDRGEECDDANTADGDGCSANCAYDVADACAPSTVIELGTSPRTLMGDTRAAIDDVQPTCGDDTGGRDVVVALEVLAQGLVRISLKASFESVLSLGSSCGASDLGCQESNTGDDNQLVIELAPGATTYVHVDGQDAKAAGAFTLTFDATHCGDGTIEPPEECDDGNLVDGDNCASSCAVECTAKPNAAATERRGDHCYQLFENALAWTEARDYCRTMIGAGYDLAAVRDEDERDFVDGTVDPGGTIWLGGTDDPLFDPDAARGAFVWINGEIWDQASEDLWDDEEPNGGNGENCVELVTQSLGEDNDRLNDALCTNPLGYLCELTPAGAP
jgi:cysteine-rich repeat protein